MENMKKKFASNLKYYIQKSNLTQEEITEKLKRHGVKIDRSQISLWTSGKTSPKLDKVDALAKVLNCSPYDLLKF